MLFFINIPEVGVDGQRLSGESRITHTQRHTLTQIHTHTHTKHWAWET